MNDNQEEAKAEARFTHGYNDGYLLSRFEPDLMKKITEGRDMKDNPYFEGMAAGQKAQARELFLENQQKSRALREQNHRPKMR